jgi:hypothetical protein
MIFFGEALLRKAVNEFISHYHHERNHQTLAHKIIQAGDEVGQLLPGSDPNPKGAY